MKTTKRIGKRLVKNAQAVSPIIATLMLVLVAVGSAGAFYMWQTGWQGDVEGKAAGGTELQASLSIGGSSTVYEFSAISGEYYHAANPGYKVSYQKGGSGAGVASVGTGAVDIGSASRDVQTSEFDQYPDLNKDGVKDFGRELIVHTVAYDAVVIIYKGDVSGGVAAVAATLTDQTITFTADTPGEDGNSITMTLVETPAADLGGDSATIDVALSGNDITVTFQDDRNPVNPESVGQVGIMNAVNLAVTGTVAGVGVNSGNNLIDCTITHDVTALIDGTDGTDFTDAVPLAQTNLDGGEESTAFDFSDGVDAAELIGAINDGTIDWYDRSDASGTEELFVGKLLGLGYDTVEEALVGNVITSDSTNSYPSNQDILGAFNSHAEPVWTFTSFGMADAGGYTICDYNGVTPDKDSIMADGAAKYAAARPINYITIGEPTGDIGLYIDFCLQPENNQKICEACDYISIY